MQAVIILVTFHALAGMAWGVGIRPEIDRDGGSVEAAAATAAVAVPGKGPIAVVATAATVSTAPSGPGDTAAVPATPPLLGHAGGEDTLQKGSNAELIGKLRAMKVTDDDSTGVRGASKLASVPAVASLLDKHGACSAALSGVGCGALRGHLTRAERVVFLCSPRGGRGRAHRTAAVADPAGRREPVLRRRRRRAVAV